jgi:hypothetical protein
MVIGTTMTTMIKVTLQVVQMVFGLLLIKRKSKAIKKILLWIKEPLYYKELTLKIILHEMGKSF